MRCSGVVELLPTKLRKKIIFSVRTPENNSTLCAVSTVCIFSIGAYLFAVRANAEYHYAINLKDRFIAESVSE